jgi:DEAD/DEAH box helicase
VNVTSLSLARVDEHWALAALGPTTIREALSAANSILVGRAFGKQIRFEFGDAPSQSDLERVALAYEMAAIDGLAAMTSPTSSRELREQCAAGAYRAFELRRVFSLPEGEAPRLYHVLHLSALAYCGDRWSDLRRWYSDNPMSTDVPSAANAEWDRRLLYRLYDCWVRLLRKQGWDDLDRIREVVAGLRQDQKEHESKVLSARQAGGRAVAFRLISLYHWAKATELLAVYMLYGDPPDIVTLLDKHFESGIEAATAANDVQLELLMRWLHAAGRSMVSGSLWWVARAVNSRATRFVEAVTKHGLFELLPPQRAALQEQGLLDQAATAVVIDMPTSGGKTLLAQFRILQALNQFDADKGWVAYVAPTRALAAQIVRRLRRDFELIGVRVEQLSGAVEIDAFEDVLLSDEGDSRFSVLVSTPEKLHLVIKNKKVKRPLALIVMDEAQNIENESRGLRIELLLATAKRDCPRANFLLLMPFVEKAETLARWLAQDVNAGRSISLGTTPWRPNERIVGTYRVESDPSEKSGWRLRFDTITSTPKALSIGGSHTVGGTRPLKLARSTLFNAKTDHQSGLGLQTAAMATVLSERGTSIAVGGRIKSVWEMARQASQALRAFNETPSEIRLVQRFLSTEVSPDFELISMLNAGVGVHHAGLSDEIRALMEWLTEEGKLRVLCATSTVSQGINFPVSSVFLASRFVPQRQRSVEMSAREFWNLAGRAGRMDQDSVGIVGIADGNKRGETVDFISRATGALASRLVSMLDELEQAGRLNQLRTIIYSEQWVDFRCYVAHLWAEKKRLDAVLADVEQLLRNTYGYGQLRATPEGKVKAEALLDVTRAYATELGNHPGTTELADATGFSPEGVRKALGEMSHLPQSADVASWTADGLFGNSSGMAELFGVMLRIPQIAESLKDVSGPGFDNRQLADVTKAWVNGLSLQAIANAYFRSNGADETTAISDACRAIYKSIVNSGTWGISALSRLSGVDFESLSESERRRLNAIPAMIYHGVRTEEGVLMRMNSAPRSAAERLGEMFHQHTSLAARSSVQQARGFLRDLDAAGWESVRPDGAALSGADYRRVWGILSGEPQRLEPTQSSSTTALLS